MAGPTGGNVNPLFIGTPNTTMFGAAVTSANTATDGTGTTSTVYTAGTQGAYVRRVKVKGAGTNVASVMRIFINNGSTSATAANNALIGELPLPATTASNNAALGPDLEYPLNLVIPAGYKIMVCFGTAGAAGWQAYCEGGDY